MSSMHYEDELQTVLGSWAPGDTVGMPLTQLEALQALDLPVYVTAPGKNLEYYCDGVAMLGQYSNDMNAAPLVAYAPPCSIDQLGSQSFRLDHGVKYPYYAGAMANGIASEELVEAMANEGLLAFFGAAGLSPQRIEAALQRLGKSLEGKPYGFNLINSPTDPSWQEAVVALYLKYELRTVEASAYVSLSPGLVRYRVTGLHRNADGEVVAPNHVIAKLSRLEVAKRFFEPAPARILKKLLAEGLITEEEAELSKEIPMASDITVEADSGGHTDHRPAMALLPAMLALRDQMQNTHGYTMPLRVGLGGGIGTPAAAASAFTLGADYIVTGSVNQACIESGTTDIVRAMLAKAAQTDVGQAPAADMFELGASVQVLKKGTRLTTRGTKLYELYRMYPSIDAIPTDELEKVEQEILRKSVDEVWQECEAFFKERDPKQLDKAAENPKHKMALVFRWYLGFSSFWAINGVEERQEDFQIWCGPAMGAFNEWVSGSYLEEAGNRKVALVAKNILFGAAVVTRAHVLHQQGIPVEDDLDLSAPLSEEELQGRLQ